MGFQPYRSAEKLVKWTVQVSVVPSTIFVGHVALSPNWSHSRPFPSWSGSHTRQELFIRFKMLWFTVLVWYTGCGDFECYISVEKKRSICHTIWINELGIHVNNVNCTPVFQDWSSFIDHKCRVHCGDIGTTRSARQIRLPELVEGKLWGGVYCLYIKITVYYYLGGGCRNLASFPGLYCFRLHEERRGPGIFSHVCDVKGRRAVERT